MALTDGLIAAWKLDGNGNDSYGSYNLTTSGTISWVAGKDGNCASYPSSGTNYLYRTAFPAPGTNAISVSFWVKWNAAPSTDQFIFSWNAYNGNRRFLTIGYQHSLAKIDAEFAWRENSSGSYINHQDVSVQDTASYPTAWAHYVIVVDLNGGKTRITMYRNGSQVANQTHSTYDYSIPSTDFCGVKLGAMKSWAESTSCTTDIIRPLLSANVDEVYYWHRAITAAEVSELYNSGIGRFYPFTGGGAPVGTRRMLTV